MNLDEIEDEFTNMLSELERKINSLDENQSIRVRALEFALGMYLNNDGSKGDNKAEGFIAFANQVYKYLKDGDLVNNEIEF